LAKGALGAVWLKAPWPGRPRALAKAPWPNPPPGAFVQNHARAPWDWLNLINNTGV